MTSKSESQKNGSSDPLTNNDLWYWKEKYWELKIQYAKVESHNDFALKRRWEMKQQIKKLKEELMEKRKKIISLSEKNQELISNQKFNPILHWIMFFMTVLEFVVAASLSALFGQLSYDVAFAFFLVALTSVCFLFYISLLLHRTMVLKDD